MYNLHYHGISTTAITFLPEHSNFRAKSVAAIYEPWLPSLKAAARCNK
jgi:hypothetical protein